MAGYLAFYRELSPRGRRQEIESFMREEFVDLWSHRAVVACAGGRPEPELALTHFTIDEPVACDGGLLLQFTYLLGRHVPCRDVIEEVRGSGLAWIDDDARIRLDDVEAELHHRMADDLVPDDLDPDDHVADDQMADDPHAEEAQEEDAPASGRLARTASGG